MEFALHYNNKKEYLYIVGQGIRNNLADMVAGTQQIAEAIAQTNKRFLLIDYSKVETKVPKGDIFNIVRIYETKMPVLASITASIVVNPDEIDAETFWEEICIKRGFNFKIFTDISPAEQWLLSQLVTESL